MPNPFIVHKTGKSRGVNNNQRKSKNKKFPKVTVNSVEDEASELTESRPSQINETESNVLNKTDHSIHTTNEINSQKSSNFEMETTHDLEPPVV